MAMPSLLKKLRSLRKQSELKKKRLSNSTLDSGNDTTPGNGNDDKTHPLMQEQYPGRPSNNSKGKGKGNGRGKANTSQANGSGRSRKKRMPRSSRKVDSKVHAGKSQTPQAKDVSNGGSSRNGETQQQQQQRQLGVQPRDATGKGSVSATATKDVPKRLRFKKKASATKEDRSISARVDPTGTLHHYVTDGSQHDRDQQERELSRETERIARAAAALDSRGNELFEKGYYDKAMEAYSKALKLKRRTFHSMLEEADDVLDDNLEDEMEQSKMDPKLLVSMATSINNIGYLRQRSGDATPDETMAAYKKSLRIKRKILGNDSLSVGKTLNNIGSVHYLKKDFVGALPAYQEALQIMKANLGAKHPDVATVISNMGDVQLAKGDPDSSLTFYRQALNIRWEAFGDRDPRTMRLLEKIARIEIGDMMGLGKSKNMHDNGWDESELFDLDMNPLTDELHNLHSEVGADMQFLDHLQKQAAVDMVKDKVVILRGMRDVVGEKEESMHSHASRRGGSSVADDEENSITMMRRGSDLSRDLAQQHVNDRLARLRSHRTDPDASQSGHESTSSMGRSVSSLFGSSYLTSLDRSALSPLKTEKLRKGVDSLRAFDPGDSQPSKPRAKPITSSTE